MEPDTTVKRPLERAVMWLMAIAVGTIVANIYYAQPLLAQIAKDFGVSAAAIGSVAMLSQLGTAAGMLLFVPLGDKYERRSLIVKLLLAAAAALGLTAMAPSLEWLMAANFAVGATAATVHVIVPFAAHLAPDEQRGKVVGTVLGGLLFGILLARTFSGVVGSLFGWRTVFWIAAGAMLMLAGVLRSRLPESAPTTQMGWPALMVSIGALVRKYRVLRQSAFLGAMFFGAFSAFWTTLVFFIEKPPYHYGAAAAGLFGLVGAAGAAGAPAIGHFADRRGTRLTISIAVATAMSSFGLLWLSGRTLAGLICGVILLDLGVQAGHVANQTRIYALDPEARSRLNTVYMFSYFAGGAIGSAAGALSWTAAGWAGVCGIGAGLLGLGLAVHVLSRQAMQ